MKLTNTIVSTGCTSRTSLRVNALLGGGRFGGGTPPGTGGRGPPGGRGGRGGRDSGLILGPESPGPRGPQKIILPGQKTGPGPRGGKIIIADGKSKVPLFQGGILTDADTVTTITGPGYYRPPAGFMNEEVDMDIAENMAPDAMISKIQTRAGRWYDLAKFLVALHQQGIDAKMVDDITGMNPVEQNLWIVGATVYDSIKADGVLSAVALEHFETPKGAALLHPFRFLTNDFRNSAVQYVADKQLDYQVCEVLARSMKEFERRDDDRHGFSAHPGDCLSFKYMRDAIESKKPDGIRKYCKKAYEVAVTDGARARVSEVLRELEDSDKPQEATASILMLRFTVDEIGFRPVALIGEYGSVVPQWKALSLARHPVGIEIPNISSVEEIMKGAKAKNDEDKKRFRGPGLLIADRYPTSPGKLDPDAYYLASPDGRSATVLIDGASLQRIGEPSTATVLFVCRPPNRDGMGMSAPASDDFEL
eukprot:gene11695-34421_t